VRVRVDLVAADFSDPDGTERGWPRDARRLTAVVIDVLRATTTLTVALANGAARVIPVAGLEPAFAWKAREPGVLLCGERDGLKVPGFDLGNSPAEYGAEAVAGRTLVFASTNGSRAMLACAGCGVRLLGAFVNASAVVAALAGRPFVRLVCAGRQGSFALEDAACAGWLCAALAARGARIEGAQARLAAALAPRDATELRALLQGAVHGRTLRSLSPLFARDVERCAELDALDRVFGFDA
jgi:2-phosphosulfolactate phosphatase